MTNREFGRRFATPDGKGHGDQWTSNLLSPKQPTSLSLQELDEAARILKTTAAQLVKGPFDYHEYLTPTEHRIVQAVRALPPAIRDHFLTLAEYLLGVAPEEIEMLLDFRHIPNEANRAKARHWIRALRLQAEPQPELALHPATRETIERSTDGEHRRRRQPQKFAHKKER